MKIKSILAAGLTAAALASCDSGSNEYHSTYFYPMTQTGIETFADQTYDTIRVVSTDTWSLTNTCQWFDVYNNGQKAPFKVEVKPGYQFSSRLDFRIQPNTTGEMRMAPVQVVSSFHKIGTLTQMLRQQPYLNIIHPAASILPNGDKKGPSFSLTVPVAGTESNGRKPTIAFIVYDNAATLTSDQSWVTPVETTGFQTGIRQNVELNVEANTTDAARTAVLTLTSNGVSTQININQTKKLEK